jgi:hypothetical protein
LGSDQATSEEVDVPNDRVLTRGDRRRNEKLTRLRSIVRRDFAVLGVDLASAKQAAVLTDHDSVVVGRRMFTGDAWVIDDILDWAGPIAAAAGFAGIVLGCEPTGHRWKPLLDRARARGVELVCVNPMLVHRGREEEDFTRDRSDFKDATIIAKKVTELRCYVPYRSRDTVVSAAAPGCPAQRPAQRGRRRPPGVPGSARVRLADGAAGCGRPAGRAPAAGRGRSRTRRRLRTRR